MYFEISPSIHNICTQTHTHIQIYSHIGILTSCDHINNILWFHHLDFIKALKEKTWWNSSRILCIVVNKSLKQYSSKWQLYSHLPLISQNIQIRQDMLGTVGKVGTNILVLLWVATYVDISINQTPKTYIHHLSTNTECCPEDSVRVMTNGD